MKFHPSKPLFWVLVLSIIATLPFIGLTDFYSKGEPREAVVALSMLKNGDWILPVNNGGDIPYKPPFFHWCIAICSLLPGYVSEFTARLPSALSLIVLTGISYMFFARRKNGQIALLTAFLLLTAFEVHRAGMACRVDMMLTVFIVGALYLFYRWWENGMEGLPVGAVLCMSGAVLTKGPVGFLLPCLVMVAFLWLRGKSFFDTLFRFIGFAILSGLLPALWYIAAYWEGGSNFFDLVMEENFGRFLGRMSYESHRHSFIYNFITLLTGWLPWTLLLLFSSLTLPWKRYLHRLKWPKPRSIRRGWFVLTGKCRDAAPLQLFVWIAFLSILLFYCIPSSKRSTYLLPCYPFMAYLIAEYIVWLIASGRGRIVRLYTGFLAVLGFVLTGLFVTVRTGVVPHSIFHGKHAADNLAMLSALEHTDLISFNGLFLALLLFVTVSTVVFLVGKSGQLRNHRLLTTTAAMVLALFFAVDGVIQPVVLNTKSDRPVAAFITKRFPNDCIYSYIKAPKMHFFATNFYTGDRIKQLDLSKPTAGILMIGARDTTEYFAEKRRFFDFKYVTHISKEVTEIRDQIFFYRLERSKRLYNER